MSQLTVIGGGFGGIAAALRARAKGYQVTLVDRCPRLGGRAQVFEREGYRHDAGPTVITAPFLFAELFELFGKRMEDYVQLVPLDLWYRFEFRDGTRFDYGGTLDQTLDEIRRINPADVEGYRRLLNDSRNIHKVGFEMLSDAPFHRFGFMLRQVPHLLRLGAWRTVWQMVCRRLDSDYLRQAFSIQPLLVGGNPFDTTSIYGLIHFLERAHGVHFAMGGTGALVDGLEKLMTEVGIRIELNQTVTGIDVVDNRVTGIHLKTGAGWRPISWSAMPIPRISTTTCCHQRHPGFQPVSRQDMRKSPWDSSSCSSAAVNSTRMSPTTRSGWAHATGNC